MQGLNRGEFSSEELEVMRIEFEADAAPLGFCLTRAPAHHHVEPWVDYLDQDTGNRWGGWLAAKAAGRVQAFVPAGLFMWDQEEERGLYLIARGWARRYGPLGGFRAWVKKTKGGREFACAMSRDALTAEEALQRLESDGVVV